MILRYKLTQLANKGDFELRQWASNHPGLISDSGSNDDTAVLTIDTDQTRKTLGLSWQRKTDQLCYNIRKSHYPQKITKRVMLSRIVQLFDPLGLLGPVILKAKLFLRALWKLDIGWNEAIPLHLHHAWQLFETQLNQVQELNIPRRIVWDDAINVQVHGFCDASQKAYGACVYLRSTDSSGSISIEFIYSKSRVAPLKSQTLPRFALCAAALLTKLLNNTLHALKMTTDQTVLWTDSMIHSPTLNKNATTRAQNIRSQ